MVGFGNRLSKIREQRGLTRADLARLADVTPAAVYQWEEKDSQPRVNTLAILCRVLGTSEDFLLDGGGSAESGPMLRSAVQVISEAKQALAIAMGVPAERIRLTIQIEA